MDTPPRSGASRRAAYRAFHDIATRWADNDVFGHVNNAAYYSYFDTAVTGWLQARGLIGLTTGPVWVLAESGCRYRGEVSFPDKLVVGLRVARLGSSSVRWEVALFRADADEASAEGHYVHVHVSRADHRPAPMPDEARAVLATVLA